MLIVLDETLRVGTGDIEINVTDKILVIRDLMLLGGDVGRQETSL